MKKFNKIVSGALMVGVLMSTGVTAFAATNTIEPYNAKSIQRGHRGLRPELTDEKKVQMADTMKERLSERLDNGNITQEHYDQAIADIADGKRPRGLAGGKGVSSDSKRPERPELTDEQKTQMADTMKEKISERLEDGHITQEQYDQAIADISEGKKPRCLGGNRGKDVSRNKKRPLK